MLDLYKRDIEDKILQGRTEEFLIDEATPPLLYEYKNGVSGDRISHAHESWGKYGISYDVARGVIESYFNTGKAVISKPTGNGIQEIITINRFDWVAGDSANVGEFTFVADTVDYVTVNAVDSVGSTLEAAFDGHAVNYIIASSGGTDEYTGSGVLVLDDIISGSLRLTTDGTTNVTGFDADMTNITFVSTQRNA